MKSDSIERAFRAVASAFGVPVVELATRRKERVICEARFALFTLLADDPSRYAADVARMLGRDEGTVLYGLKRARELAEQDKGYAAKLAKARELHEQPRQTTQL